MANFMLKIRNFRYHGKNLRGCLKQISTTLLNCSTTPKPPVRCKYPASIFNNGARVIAVHSLGVFIGRGAFFRIFGEERGKFNF